MKGIIQLINITMSYMQIDDVYSSTNYTYCIKSIQKVIIIKLISLIF